MEGGLILLVCSDSQFVLQLADSIQLKKSKLIETPDDANAVRLASSKKPQLVLVHSDKGTNDHKLDVVAQIRASHPQTPIVLATRHSSEERVIAALRAGVTDYFRLPYDFNKLLKSVTSRLRRDDSPAAPALSDLPIIHRLIGQSECMCNIRSFLLKVATAKSTVLLTGETGTGKGLMAWLLHQNSGRKKGPFVPVNCPAIPDNLVESELFGYERGAFTGAVSAARGRFEAAHRGTLFLDEISDMALQAQAKILRTIEDKENFRVGARSAIPLDVWVLAATNRSPEQLVREGRLRPDLFYRLNVARINLPTLRERKEDIPQLLEHFIRKFNRIFEKRLTGVSDEVMEVMLCYDWPGNVRQLKNVLESTFINATGRLVRYSDLPLEFRQECARDDGDNTDGNDEREKIIASLLASKGNKSKAAQLLNWSRMTLYRKISKYHLENIDLPRQAG